MIESVKLELLQEKLNAGYFCEKCGAADFYIISTRAILKCTVCRRQHGLWAGTVLQDIKIAPDIIIKLIEELVLDKNQSTTSLAKIAGITQKSAWKFKSRILPYIMEDEIITLFKIFRSKSTMPFQELLKKERESAVKNFDKYGSQYASSIHAIDRIGSALTTTIKSKRLSF